MSLAVRPAKLARRLVSSKPLGYPGCMQSIEAAVKAKLGPVPHRSAQQRIIEAALVLFAEHGVSATSLQRIADAVGVTKAAVYHQFRSKDQIVLAVAEVVRAGLEAAVEAAEAEESRTRSREVLLSGMVELGVGHRLLAIILQRDPIMLRFQDEHEPFRNVMTRLYRVLTGGRSGPRARVAAAMISSAIAGGVIHPLARDLDDETLRSHLLDLSRQCLVLLP